MEEQTTLSIWGGIDIALIIFAAIIVLIVLYFQIKSFKETRKKIYELISFFPNINSISIFKSSIKKSDIESSQALQKFINSPRKRQEVQVLVKCVCCEPEKKIMHTKSAEVEKNAANPVIMFTCKFCYKSCKNSYIT